MIAARRLAAALLGAVTALAACSSQEDSGEPSRPAQEQGQPPRAQPSPPPTQLARFYTQRPDWKDCGGGFQCATLTVPLDYAAPTDGDISLALVRRPASDQKKRIGSLLVNPGGPGASGVQFARAADRIVTKAVRSRFDIVGFDPRGVADSTPVRCQTDAETDRFLAVDGSPDDAAEERTALEVAREFAQNCKRRAGRLLPHVSTANAARDMDVMRAALGDESLHYLGKSYGTLLGATYAGLFPSRVGRLVLDGALDPAASNAEINREQTKGFELALTSFVDDCLERRGCPLPAPREAALRAVGDLLERADREPLRGDGQRPVTQALAVLGVAAALYQQENWTVLRQALTEAGRGDGRTLLLLADFYTDREAGRFVSNSNDVIYAVNCLDRSGETDIASIKREAVELQKLSPRFGAYLAWSSLPCRDWPVQAAGRAQRITAEGAAPIVVVGTSRDPATPLVWARALADQLSSGVLLEWDGDGHTAYRRGSECVDDAVDRYLLEGKPPTDGQRCK